MRANMPLWKSCPTTTCYVTQRVLVSDSNFFIGKVQFNAAEIPSQLLCLIALIHLFADTGHPCLFLRNFPAVAPTWVQLLHRPMSNSKDTGPAGVHACPELH